MDSLQQFKQKYVLGGYKFWVPKFSNDMVLVINSEIKITDGFNELKTIDAVVKRQDKIWRLFYNVGDPTTGVKSQFTDFSSIEELQQHMLVKKLSGLT